MTAAVAAAAKSAGGREVPSRDILGNLEVRRLAGRELGGRKPITRATLLRWREREDFPPPFRSVSSGDLWDRREVLLWLWEHRDTA